MRKCLVTGASGFLGREVVARLSRGWEVVGLSLHHGGAGLRRVDLRQPEALRDVLADVRPDLVVHCAAYRDPDFCERDPEETRRLNVQPARVLCESLPAAARLVFISSDYVFDGDHPPYFEDSPRRPLSLYGRSKVEAEDIVLGRAGSVVIRNPVMIGAGPDAESSGFITQMWRAIRDRRPVERDDLRIRFPTWTRDVAAAVEFVVEKGLGGAFHVSGPRGGTAYALTMETAAILGQPAGHIRPSKAIPPGQAPRPQNSQLATDKLRSLGCLGFTDFAVVVRTVLESFGIAVRR